MCPLHPLQTNPYQIHPQPPHFGRSPEPVVQGLGEREAGPGVLAELVGGEHAADGPVQLAGGADPFAGPSGVAPQTRVVRDPRVVPIPADEDLGLAGDKHDGPVAVVAPVAEFQPHHRLDNVDGRHEARGFGLEHLDLYLGFDSALHLSVADVFLEREAGHRGVGV